MATIADLMAKLSLDSANFQEGMNKAIEQTEKLGGSMKKGHGAVATMAKVIGGTGAAGLIAFGAAANGAMLAMTGLTLAVGKMAFDAMPVESIRAAFDGLSQSMGKSGDAMLEAMQKGSKGLIDNKSLMMSFNKAAQLVSKDFAGQLPDAMQYLSKVAAATGQDMGFMLDSLVTGVGRLSPMILDNLGIQVNLTEASEAWAKANGRTVESMSKAEQQTAMMNMVLEKLQRNTASMPEVTETAAAQWAAFKTKVANAKDEIGLAFLPVLKTVFASLQQMADIILPVVVPAIEAFAGAWQKVLAVLSPLMPVFAAFGAGITKAFGKIFEGDFEGGSAKIGKEFLAIAKVFSGSETSKAVLEGGAKMIIGMVQGIASAIPDIMTAINMIVTTILKLFIDNLGQFISIGLDLIINLALGIAQAIPQLIPMAIQMILVFVDAVLDSIPKLLAAGVQIINTIVTAILQSLPQLVSSAVIILVMLINTIIQNLPMLLEAGMNIILGLVQAIINNLPLMLTSVLSLIQFIVDSVVTFLPILIPMAIEIILTILNALIEALPVILSAGVEILLALVDGIIQMLPILITGAIEIILALATAILEMLPELVIVAIDIILALVEGLLQATPQLIALIPEIIGQLIEAIIILLPLILEAGVEILTAIWDGIKETVPLLVAEIPKIWDAIKQAWDNLMTPIKEVGQNIVQGIMDGVESWWSNLKGMFTTKIQEIVKWVKGLLGIGSPSKIFAEIGENLNKGLALGIKQTIELPEKAFHVPAMNWLESYVNDEPRSLTIENINNYMSGGWDAVQYSIDRAKASIV